MKKINRLIKEAVGSCNYRGHRMGRFTHWQAGNNTLKAESICLYCSAYVQVNTNPMPNEIEIGGEAVALNCE